MQGGTDIGLWVTKQLRDIGKLIYLGQVAELHAMTERDDFLEIGATVSLEYAYEKLCSHYPDTLFEMWQRFASLPVRNAVTLGGNVANGSPIGDSMPFLIVLGAEIKLRSYAGQRVIPLEEFYLGYQKKDLHPSEFIECIRVPLSPIPRTHQVDQLFRTYKLSKRFGQDISAVCAAFAFKPHDGLIVEARIAFGGLAEIPKRAKATEATLLGQQWIKATLKKAMEVLAAEYTPLTDMRASSAYRVKAAQNLLHRFWLETRSSEPLPVPAVNVFACE